MTAFTQDQWMILALVFVLGLLVGVFMTAGGRKKWKTRYYDERKRLEERERAYEDREKHWADQEKEWRERDSLRAAAVKDRRDPEERPL
jgi:hypothetical protein